MKKVVVTGAGGFIGNNLAIKLLNSGVTVFGVTSSHNKVENLQKFENFFPIVAKFDEYDRLNTFIQQTDIDVFFHFAWMGMDQGRLDFDVQINNVIATQLAANSAVKMGCKRFLMACSSHEYQKSTNKFHGVEHVGLCSVYGASKIAAKAYARVIAQNNGMDYIGAIFTNVFGIGDRSKRTTNTFIRKLLNGEQLDLIEGDALYDWVYIDDAVNGIIAISEKGIRDKEYYVGNLELRPFRDIVEEVRDILVPNATLNFGAYKDTSFIDFSSIDIHELNRDTGYVPQSNFRESILETAEWVRSLEVV